MSLPAEPRPLVADLVRLIGARARHPTTVRFGEQDGAPVPVALTRIHPAAGSDDTGYRRLLETEARLERTQPCRLRAIACALIAPERGIAYVQHATGSVATLPIGSRLHDDAAIPGTIAAGLRALMQALQENQPVGRPGGHAFAGRDIPSARTPPGPAVPPTDARRRPRR